MIPCRASFIETQLANECIVRTPKTLDWLANICLFFRVPFPFEICRIQDSNIVVAYGTQATAKRILTSALASVSKWGATHIDEIGRLIKLRTDRQSTSFVRRSLECLVEFSWLDQTHGWFWFGPKADSRLLRRTKRILSACRQIDVKGLTKLIELDVRMKGFCLPEHVLLEMFSRYEWLCVHGDQICVRKQFDLNGALRKSDRLFLRVLSKFGPRLSLYDFRERCRAAGMKQSSFYSHVAVSLILKKYDNGEFGLLLSEES